MPNALAHIGIHALITRGLVRKASMGWILVGCLLPDLPWILQRLVRGLPLEISPYDLRTYMVVQSAFALCLVAAGALACLSTRPLRTGLVLALGCLVHLLLDATQTKWANGVVLFAPFDWRLLNFGFYWPEDGFALAMTSFGFGYFAWAWLRIRPWHGAAAVPLLPRKRYAAAVCLAAAYMLLPLGLMAPAVQADPHYIGTLRQVEARPGREAGFDRSWVIREPGKAPALQIWTGEQLQLTGLPLPENARRVSVTGSFIQQRTFAVDALHVHPPQRRDIFSYLGLMGMAAWAAAGLRRRRSP
ncbi:hypothetical protein AB9K35_11520 [Leisingera sp. XS_AS12]|uniref:hypothetical protein n=1 Tax=Leisingera sp. XS_AS12 TaxID=3241294 RepID=UPI003514FA47